MSGAAPTRLRVDHLVRPLDLGDAAPTLSWTLPDGATRQDAYRVVAGSWDSGRVASSASTFVRAETVPLSGAVVPWRVKTWTDLGESVWSQTGLYEHGLLRPQDWQADWVAPVEGAGPPRQRPVTQLAGPVRLPGDVQVVRARLHATAHGVYEAFVNGHRVGDEELTPGWTAYRSRLQVQTFDVTDLLVPGENVLGALLSDGWWRGQNSVARRVDDYGTTTALLAQLVVTTADGEQLISGSGGDWRAAPSHVLAADLMAGEVHDLRQRRPWSQWSSWAPVRVEDHGHLDLCASPAPPVRRVQELRPVGVRQLAPHRWVVDLGQNVSGWVRLRGLGLAGEETTLTYGEWLDEHGDVTQEHIASPASTTVDRSVPFQVDRVTSAGRADEVFEPRHSTKGFQYVRVEAHRSALTVDDVTGIVVHTDFARLGTFSCSDPRLEAVHRIADWSFRGNACDLPTDCPTRERAGWTGDCQIFAETAAFLYDTAGFSLKWLRDLAADQRPDGRVTSLVPESHPGDDRSPDWWPSVEGSSGWGDAAVQVPWQVYRATGDARVLADQWPSMQAWVDYAARAARTGRRAARLARQPDPAAHEQYLWDTGWHFGEWLEPGDDVAAAIARAEVEDPGPVATAYLYRSASQLAQAAHVLGREDEATRYSALADAIADAWQREFLSADGRTTPDSQATCARALAFGLIPPSRRRSVADRLAELVREAGCRVGTGFLATPFLLPALADHGHLDLAYEVLLQDAEPSWLLMLERGATTVWEQWDGISGSGEPHASLNHYSKGAVISFLHQHVAGLQLLEPGWRRARIAPRPGGGLTRASASHRTPYGLVAVAWQVTGSELHVDVTVPASTTVELLLPGHGPRELTPGAHHATALLPGMTSHDVV